MLPRGRQGGRGSKEGLSMPKITKRLVERLQPDPGGNEVFVWDSGDGAIKGFGIRMKPSGTASFIIQYRTREGRTRRLAIGKVGILSPGEARSQARDRLVEVARGADPSAERHKLRHAITIAELCDLNFAEAEGRVNSPTLPMDHIRFKSHAKHPIALRPL